MEKQRSKNLPTEGRDVTLLEVDAAFRLLKLEGEEDAKQWLQYDNQ